MINEYSEQINKALLEMNFTSLTPIQTEVIPKVLEGLDVIAQAPTGTGKTCAFGLPIVESVVASSKDLQALIICPTRELAKQITDELRKLAKYKEGVRIASVYGGEYFERQLANLRKKPQIIVGTPGRILDHIERRTIKMKSVETIVLDEADEMLNMGFLDDMEKIFEKANEDRQTLMFSATMPSEILEISKKFQREPVSVKTQLDEKDLPPITQYYAYVEENQKIFLLDTLIKQNEYKLSLCFVSMKKRCDQLNKVLKSKGYKCECLHGDLKQAKREQIMKGYKNGEYDVLIATDVAARGIDVKGIDAIFNFDIPYDREFYIHRIGRTARNKATGEAYTFVTSGERNKIAEIERYTDTKMIKLEEFSQDNLRKYMNNKKIDNALTKIKGNLGETKAQITKQLEDFNFENGTNYTVLDIAAALVESDTMGITLSKNREEAVVSSKKKEKGVRYFVNFGERDKATKKNVAEFLKKEIGVVSSEIIEISLMDNYGFIELVVGADDNMYKLVGKNFNGREVNVEKAGEKERGAKKQAGKKKSFEKPSKKTYASKNANGKRGRK
ncbi:MAG: DEAD/DEAH box helicase [Eubacteriales bacterium]|nr:DEAD/DEAH box helicase [Eubacteriales bacterium]